MANERLSMSIQKCLCQVRLCDMRICEKRQIEIISSRSAALLVWLRPVGYGGYKLNFQTLDRND